MKIHIVKLFIFSGLSLSLIAKISQAQTCNGSWVTNIPLSYQCISGQNIGSNNNYPDPPGCPVNPVYTATQTNTFIFDTPVNNFSIDFNAFSSSPGCARLQIKINGVFYHLTSANLVELPTGANCFGSVNYLAVTSDGYITGGPTSLYNTNGQGRMLFSGVNASSITISTNDGASSVYTSPCTPVVVPIKLKSFIGIEKQFCKAILNWETSIESNVQKIEIWRSQDGNDFKKAGEVLPQGSNSHYTFETDQYGNTYYKLKTINLDGGYQYSPIIYIKSTCNKIIYQLTPNPASYSVKVIGLKPKDKIFIMDVPGKIEMVSTIIQPDNEFDIHHLVNGVYCIRIIHNNEISANLKMIKY